MANMRAPRLPKIKLPDDTPEPTQAEKETTFKAAGLAKIKGVSTTYDHNRPKRQVITRYTR